MSRVLFFVHWLGIVAWWRCFNGGWSVNGGRGIYEYGWIALMDHCCCFMETQMDRGSVALVGVWALALVLGGFKGISGVRGWWSVV